MRRIIKNMIIQFIVSIIISIFIYNIMGIKVAAIIILAILLLLACIKPFILLLNKLVRKTNWYKAKVGDGVKFCKNIPLDLDICNLGSASGNYAFKYENTGLKGENWALRPQTLSYDYRVLKNYFSYLKEGATVLIPLCPLSSCIKDFEEDKYNYKYYSFLHPILILNFSQKIYDKVMNFIYKPFISSPVKSLIRIIKDIPVENVGVMSNEQLEVDALTFINNWKKQFLITDLDLPVSDENKDCMIYNINLLNNIISFCLERKLKPVIVIPPITKSLSSKLSEKFRENYIYTFVRNANIHHVNFLNYIDDESLTDDKLFFNSYFLNKKGQNLFTVKVLKDLTLI